MKRGACSDRTKRNEFKLTVGLDYILGKKSYCDHGEALEQVAQESCGSLNPGSVQG